MDQSRTLSGCTKLVIVGFLLPVAVGVVILAIEYGLFVQSGPESPTTSDQRRSEESPDGRVAQKDPQSGLDGNSEERVAGSWQAARGNLIYRLDLFSDGRFESRTKIGE